MINYQEALSLIDKISLKLPNEKISTLNSVNRVCAEDILSPSTNPRIFYLHQLIRLPIIPRLMALLS